MHANSTSSDISLANLVRAVTTDNSNKDWREVAADLSLDLDRLASRSALPTHFLAALATARQSPLIPPALRVEHDSEGRPHPHATTGYGLLKSIDVTNAVVDFARAVELGAAELNFHLPYETQFARHRNLEAGARFMDFVDGVGRRCGVKAVWENSCILDTSDWSIVENQSCTPPARALCLDIGHLMLGAASQDQARQRIDTFLEQHGTAISHLHLHINDLRRDQHICSPETVITFLGRARFERLTAGRSFIFEKGR